MIAWLALGGLALLLSLALLRGFATAPVAQVRRFGAWGLAAVDASEKSTEYMVTFGIKMMLVAGAVIATLIHSNGTSKLAKGLGGAIGLLATLFAAYCGVLLAHVG